MHLGRNSKLEDDLAVSIKKALTADETAPKQKHVRNIILYTWDVGGGGSFWNALKGYPLLGDETVIFKTLITIHKVIRQVFTAVYIRHKFYANIRGIRCALKKEFQKKAG